MSKAFVIIFFFTVFTSEASQGLNNDSLKISSVTRLFKKAFKNEISKLEIEEINVITGSDGDYVDMDWNSKKWTVYLSANQNTIMTDSYLLLIC
ncbi:MAG: hypothetical protein VX341_00870, partial [Bdellovibrionota bacterium]|nr:hypothetical protein [Bdellovibrionota bacterium]